MIIDHFAISKLKNFLYYNDRPVLLKSCVRSCNLQKIDEDIKKSIIEREFTIVGDSDQNVHVSIDNSTQQKELAFRDNLNNNKTISILEFELINEDAADAVNEIKNIFHEKLGATATCHMYMGKAGSESFGPHADIPCNFIFQLMGKSRAIVYENRCSTLIGIETIYFTGRKEKIYAEEMRPLLDVVLEPGDVIYIPAKQYHKIEPLEDRISFSIPVISHENWYGLTQRLE